MKRYRLCSLNVVVYCPSAGNLGRVDYISDFEYDLFIRPDTCNPRYRVWFYFTVENVKADQVHWQSAKEVVIKILLCVCT